MKFRRASNSYHLKLFAALCSAYALSACQNIDRPYNLRFWEFNRLCCRKETARHNYDKAYRFAKSAVSYAKNLGDSDFRLAVSLSDLGLLHMKRKNHDSARSYYKQALAVLGRAEKQKSNTLEAEIIEVEKASVLKNLGLLAYNKGDYAKAADNYAGAVAIYASRSKSSKVNRGDPLALDYARSAFGLAMSCQKLNRVEPAGENFARALELSETNEFPIAESVRSAYTKFLQDHGRIEEAKKLNYQKDWLATSLKARGFYLEQNYAEAAKVYSEALAIAEEMGENSLLRVAVSLHSMANSYQHLGEPEKAALFDRRAYATLERMEEPPYSFKDSLLSREAFCLKQAGKYEELFMLLQQQKILRKKYYPELLNETYADLAELEGMRQNKEVELRFANLALKSFSEFPAYKRSTAYAQARIADIFLLDKDYANAEAAMKNVVTIVKDKLHIDDQRVPVALFRLADIQIRQGKVEEAEKNEELAIIELKKRKTRRFLDAAASLDELCLKELNSQNLESARRFGKWAEEVAFLSTSLKDLSPEQKTQLEGISKRLESKLKRLK